MTSFLVYSQALSDFLFLTKTPGGRFSWETDHLKGEVNFLKPHGEGFHFKMKANKIKARNRYFFFVICFFSFKTSVTTFHVRISRSISFHLLAKFSKIWLCQHFLNIFMMMEIDYFYIFVRANYTTVNILVHRPWICVKSC